MFHVCILDFLSEKPNNRKEKPIPFNLQDDNINIEETRKWAWNGIPDEKRADSWKILLGYLSSNKRNRMSLLIQKRNEYLEIIKNMEERKYETKEGAETRRQIEVDIPRMLPNVKLFEREWIRECIKRILICFSIRRPFIGYIQGINDIVAPFLYVFLKEKILLSQKNSLFLSKKTISDLEADCFWCFMILMDTIQENYAHSHEGVFKKIDFLKKLTLRFDSELYNHLKQEGVDFFIFSFRWFNCLLIREIPLQLIVRMWDTYFAEGKRGFSLFHSFVCFSFLLRWRDLIMLLSFPDIVLTLQNPPTTKWEEDEISLLLSEAYFFQFASPQ